MQDTIQNSIAWGNPRLSNLRNETGDQDRVLMPAGHRDFAFALIDAVLSMQARYESAPAGRRELRDLAASARP